jgi:hypothetical protein
MFFVCVVSWMLLCSRLSLRAAVPNVLEHSCFNPLVYVLGCGNLEQLYVIFMYFSCIYVLLYLPIQSHINYCKTVKLSP